MFEISLIGKKIKKIRKQKKISQEKLAEMISMNHRSIVRIENAQVVPTLETLGKIAEVLDVKIADFFEVQEFQTREEIVQNINLKLSKMSDDELKAFYKSVCHFFY